MHIACPLTVHDDGHFFTTPPEPSAYAVTLGILRVEPQGPDLRASGRRLREGQHTVVRRGGRVHAVIVVLYGRVGTYEAKLVLTRLDVDSGTSVRRQQQHEIPASTMRRQGVLLTPGRPPP